MLLCTCSMYGTQYIVYTRCLVYCVSMVRSMCMRSCICMVVMGYNVCVMISLRLIKIQSYIYTNEYDKTINAFVR